MGNVRDFLANLYRIDPAGQDRATRLLITVLRFLNELKAQFVKDTVVVRASGMAYTTLLAIVPLVAVLFSVLSAFSSFAEYKDQIQTWLFSQIVPAKSGEVLEYINQFTANTKALGALSTLLLVITSLLLFDNIEKNFNALWGVTRKRSTIQRFITFTNVLMWGPILFAMSFLVSGKIRLFISSNPLLDIGFVTRFLFGILPYLFTAFAFVLMLVVVPATKVRWRSALLGGLIGGAIWEVGKVLFTQTTAKSITYNAIYGSIAVVPIFLVWLYVTWIIVLLAVEISYVHHNFQGLVLHRAFARPSARERLHLGVRLLMHVAGDFYRGGRPVTLEELENRFRIPSELAEQLTDKLTAAGLLHRIDVSAEETGLAPGKSLAAIHFNEVVEAVYRDGAGAEAEKGLDALDELATRLLKQGENAAVGVYAQSTLLQLVEKAMGQGAADLPAGA